MRISRGAPRERRRACRAGRTAETAVAEAGRRLATSSRTRRSVRAARRLRARAGAAALLRPAGRRKGSAGGLGQGVFEVCGGDVDGFCNLLSVAKASRPRGARQRGGAEQEDGAGLPRGCRARRRAWVRVPSEVESVRGSTCSARHKGRPGPRGRGLKGSRLRHRGCGRARGAAAARPTRRRESCGVHQGKSVDGRRRTSREACWRGCRRRDAAGGRRCDAAGGCLRGRWRW